MTAHISNIPGSDITLPDGYLKNRLLIATPMVDSPAFSRSVVLMFSHDAQGAMGIIINHIIENISYQDLFAQLSIDGTAVCTDLPVHYGGPLEINRGFVIYHVEDTPHPDTMLTIENTAVSSSLNMLRDIAQGKGPRDRMLALGYAGWGPGQLEAELKTNAWISVPATRELIFEPDNNAKWKNSAEAYGIDINRLTSNVGHA